MHVSIYIYMYIYIFIYMCFIPNWALSPATAVSAELEPLPNEAKTPSLHRRVGMQALWLGGWGGLHHPPPRLTPF